MGRCHRGRPRPGARARARAVPQGGARAARRPHGPGRRRADAVPGARRAAHGAHPPPRRVPRPVRRPARRRGGERPLGRCRQGGAEGEGDGAPQRRADGDRRPARHDPRRGERQPRHRHRRERGPARRIHRRLSGARQRRPRGGRPRSPRARTRRRARRPPVDGPQPPARGRPRRTPRHLARMGDHGTAWPARVDGARAAGGGVRRTVRRLGGWSVRATAVVIAFLTAYPPNRLTAQHLWRPEDRALISDFSYVVAVAASAFTVFGATAHGLIIYERQARGWPSPTPPGTRSGSAPPPAGPATTWTRSGGTPDPWPAVSPT